MILPGGLRAGLGRLLEGVSRTDLARRAEAISERYRQGRGSAGVIRDAHDALAYAVTRLPATYAATATAVAHAAAALPDFAPRSLVDLGAGPGTASHAALAQWPGIASVVEIEQNAAFRTLAAQLARDSGHAALEEATRLDRDIRRLAGAAASPVDPDLPEADVVVASYVLVELAGDEVEQLVANVALSGALLIVLVEPGTPAGFACIRRARQALIAAGLVPVAPCPGGVACPMAGQDWCHYSVRLPRLRDHRLVKRGDAPFEDERFAYVAATRLPAGLPQSRILAEPEVDRAAVSLKLCTSAGLEQRTVRRGDGDAYKRARKLSWGDALPEA